MNTDKITIETGVQHFKNLSKLFLWFSSQKHLPNASEALPAPRKLTKFELCTAVLTSQLKHVLAQYNSAHGTTSACELDVLTCLLKGSAEAVQVNRILLNQYKSIAIGSCAIPKDGKISKKKARSTGQGKEPGEAIHSNKKECKYCRKWKSHNKDSHSTNKCRIYNTDGTVKPCQQGGGKCGGACGHKKYNNDIGKVKELEM